MVDFRRSRTRELGVVLVLALLVVDGALVVMALRNQPEPPTVTVMDDPPPLATPTKSPTPERPTSPSPAPSPTPSPSTTTPTTTPTADPETPRELPLSVLDEQTAVRGTPGSCAEGGGSVEITEDGGESWTPISMPDPELAVLRVRIEDDRLWFIGAGSDCTEAFYQKATASEGWDRSNSTGSAWHLLADVESPAVHAPDEVRTAACQDSDAAVVELETSLNAPARLLCSDGTVHVTQDSAANWNELGQVPGARAMGVADGRPLVAATGAEGCDGLAVQEPTPDGPRQVGCADGAEVVDDDGVALSFAGPAGFLLAGGETWTTTDGGVSWDTAGTAQAETPDGSPALG